MQAENDEGNIEYKLKLNPSDKRKRKRGPQDIKEKATSLTQGTRKSQRLNPSNVVEGGGKKHTKRTKRKRRRRRRTLKRKSKRRRSRK